MIFEAVEQNGSTLTMQFESLLTLISISIKQRLDKLNKTNNGKFVYIRVFVNY
jgi:hypothetical protein